MNNLIKILGIAIAILAIVGGIAMQNSNKTEFNHNNVFRLQMPSFLTANAEGLNGDDGTSFLEEEAGISAYTNVGGEIDLQQAKNAFRTIEYETSYYIIGSVPLSGYAETEDVHCYVNKDGWILTYYLNEEPASKIFDWQSYTGGAITGTKLDKGIIEVCDQAGVIPGEIKYYDFEYPNANGLMIVADYLGGSGTDTFNITLPSDYIFYERSYLHCSRGYNYNPSAVYAQYSYMYIDNHLISTVLGGNWGYDFITPSTLPVGSSHVVKVTASYYASDFYSYPALDAIVLIYKEA